MSSEGSSGFAVSEERMRPARCPACGYSWQGLSEPRCPECGERVADGEVVILGVPRSDNSWFPDGSSWLKDMAVGGVICVIAGAAIFPLEGLDNAAVAILGGLVVLYWILGSARWWIERRHGFPRGVVRFSAAGIRFGAGERKGRMRCWPKAMRLTMTRRSAEVIRLRGSVCLGRVALSDVFDVYAQVNAGQARGIAERLLAWGPKKLEIIERDRRRKKSPDAPVVHWASREKENSAEEK